ncbi:MAG: hypothetical protein APF81_13550 [Desulfosporosinus sp. BRH_c37]|nr:MAG: hypothetical protein APF81_13550 [Desulfosporosinus sp. BRH_c37]
MFTFVSPTYPYNEKPLYDLDMASYSVVKTFGEQLGATYKGMPWETKESFAAVADYYAREK